MDDTTISAPAIPQPGTKFRLASLQSSKVLVAKFNNHLVNHPQGQVYADQWFSLEPAPTPGTYYTRSSASRKVIYSKRGAVGMYKKSYYKDQYFMFDPGSGQFQGYFRLRNNYPRMVIYDNGQRGVGNFDADGEKYSDQYYSFLEYQS
ncbi:hypothetical protein BJY00DRAFT_319480 [Aspergillus carlsbadensis]|nr:hypothetical protein BJY00DRAFT_319480 [Aspergillus carlsbadensis]